MDNQEIILEQMKISELDSAVPPKRFRTSDIRFVYWSKGLNWAADLGTLRICLETDKDFIFVDEQKKNLYRVAKEQLRDPRVKAALVKAGALCDPAIYGGLTKLNTTTPRDAIRKRGLLHSFYEKSLPQALKQLDPGGLDSFFGDVRRFPAEITAEQLLEIVNVTQRFAFDCATYEEQEIIKLRERKSDYFDTEEKQEEDIVAKQGRNMPQELELSNIAEKFPYKLRVFCGTIARGIKHHGGKILGAIGGAVIGDIVMRNLIAENPMLSNTPEGAVLYTSMVAFAAFLGGFVSNYIIDHDERSNLGS